MTTRVRIQPDPAAALSQAVATLLQRALRHADEVHQDISPRGYVTAVHEFRKALRRARGIVAFARPICAPEPYAHVSTMLRGAFRSTGALRDSTVRLTLLEQLHRVAALDPMGPVLHDTLSSGQPTPQHAALVLNAAAQAAAEALPVFQSALGAATDMDQLEVALARANRRVRRAFRLARKSGGDEAFHEWRKRLKDWRAVHDMIDKWGDTGPMNQCRELATITQRFGALTDLILLQRTVQAQAGEQADGPLLRTLQRRIRARKRYLLLWGERQHAAGPTLVAARLRGALEATWCGPTRSNRP
jgi:CHAD domain-containing protein